MTHRVLAPLIAAVLITGCDEIGCPEGTVFNAATRTCVAVSADLGVSDAAVVDLGPQDTGPRDIGHDAGPCGMSCVGALVCNPSSGECVQCLGNEDCGGSRPVCDTTAGRCVGCVGHEDCTDSAAPVCVAQRCEECATNADCPVSAPVCNPSSRTCGPCFSRADCSGRVGTPACNTSTGACALCDAPNETADCAGLRCLNQTMCTPCRAMTAIVDCPTTSASRCSTTGSCVPCLDNSGCAHIAGRPRCDAGTCVACTVATEATDCGTKSCDPATRTCTTTDRLSRQQCESCVADNECSQSGGTARCISMHYQGVPRGGYCLRAVPDCNAPFLTGVSGASLSGAPSATYCGIYQDTISCEAVRALLTSRQCPTGSASDCMALGARCEMVGALSNRCTYSCGVANNCPSGLSCEWGYCGS